MVVKKTWKEFREAGLLWWINTILHMFGWAIVYEIDEDKITDVYPARVKFRGFGEEDVEKGYKKVSKYLLDNIAELEKETQD
jgi:hypothetical protein